MGVTLVLPAAGAGVRFGGEVPKQLLPLAGIPILRRSLDAFAGLIEEAVVPVSDAGRDAVAEALAGSLVPVRLIRGGETRQASVHAGLLAADPAHGLVLVHDAVRPLVPRACIVACIAALAVHQAAVVAIACADTVKRANGTMVAATVPREGLWLAQTPQGFRLASGLAAFARADAEGWACSDDAQVLERAGVAVAVVAGDRRNLKITTPDDLALAAALLRTG